MRSQVLLLEALLVFAVLTMLLVLSVPLHVETSELLRTVREKDLEQVRRLLSSSP
ncbi:MAG: hypothetical protein GXO00_03215 [Candidatus Diapherotrites archaeon]|nr:hypothetical protein [Candidatus Diapherotrites archaeon]